MKKNAIKFLYAIDCYLLYMLSGVVSAAGVVAYYSIRAAADFRGGMEYNAFSENLSVFLSGKSSLVLLLSYCLVIFALLLMFMFKKKKLGTYSGLSYARPLSTVASILLGACMALVTYRFTPENAGEGTEITSILIVCIIIGPLVEELMFRGVLLKMFGASCGMFFSVVLTSLLFAFSHSEGIQIAYAFILGLVLAVVRIKSTSLWSVIALHLSFNISGAVLSVVRPEMTINNVVFVIVISALLLFGACSGGRKRAAVRSE